MKDNSIGVRIQRMQIADQTLILASIASGRSVDGTFSGRAVKGLFYDTTLPAPAKISNVIAGLGRGGLTAPAKAYGEWSLTPVGRQQVADLVGNDAAALLAEALPGGADLAHSRHPLIPASLAPPQLLGPVAEFTKSSPSASQVFGMTRFPVASAESEGRDPVAAGLEAAAAALDAHSLRFLLASQRVLVGRALGECCRSHVGMQLRIGIFRRSPWPRHELQSRN